MRKVAPGKAVMENTSKLGRSAMLKSKMPRRPGPQLIEVACGWQGGRCWGAVRSTGTSAKAVVGVVRYREVPSELGFPVPNNTGAPFPVRLSIEVACGFEPQ